MLAVFSACSVSIQSWLLCFVFLAPQARTLLCVSGSTSFPWFRFTSEPFLEKAMSYSVFCFLLAIPAQHSLTRVSGVLVSSGQERLGPLGTNPEEGHGNEQRAGAHLLWDRLTELGLLSLDKRRTWGDLIAALQYLRGCFLIRKMGMNFFTWASSSRTRGNGFNLKEGRCRLVIRKSLLHSGIDCPEKCWMPYPWKHPRSG